MHDHVMSANLVIERDQHTDRSVLTLYGELDLASASLLAASLGEAESSGATEVVIDLGALEFIDSAGLHTLLDANSRSIARGHRLSLLRGPRPVQRLFELTETASFFAFDD